MERECPIFTVGKTKGPPALSHPGLSPLGTVKAEIAGHLEERPTSVTELASCIAIQDSAMPGGRWRSTLSTSDEL